MDSTFFKSICSAVEEIHKNNATKVSSWESFYKKCIKLLEENLLSNSVATLFLVVFGTTGYISNRR